MREIRLDGRKMDSRADAWAHLRKEMDLPAYFGNNLDALADWLGETGGLSITLLYADAARNALGEYANTMILIFEETAARRPDIRFQLGKR